MRIVILLGLLVAASTASAQEPAVDELRLTEPEDVLPLRRGTPAPRDGLLINAADLLQIRAEYERLRYLLDRTTERDGEVCDVRVQMEHAHVVAAEERLALRDDLWGERQQELLAQLAAMQERANRAAERGWWESPALWAVVGGAIVGAIWIAASVR